MLLIRNDQIKQLKVHAENNYKKVLCAKMCIRYNSHKNISNEEFEKRILMNYETARHYHFDTKASVEKFIDYTFLYESLNNPAPLNEKLHSELINQEITPAVKFKILSKLLASENSNNK